VWLQQPPTHSTTTSCRILVATSDGDTMSHPSLLFFSSLGGAMPVQPAQVSSVELGAQPAIGQLGTLLVCACSGPTWRQVLSGSALLLWQFSSVDPSATRLQDWAYLPLSMALERWGRSREESRRGILPFLCFPVQKISPEITSISRPGNTDFKADKSNAS